MGLNGPTSLGVTDGAKPIETPPAATAPLQTPSPANPEDRPDVPVVPPSPPEPPAMTAAQFKRFAATCEGYDSPQSVLRKHVMIDPEGGPRVEDIPQEYLHLIDHCESRRFVEMFTAATGVTLTSGEKNRLEIFQRNFNVIFSYSKKTHVDSTDPEKPVIYIQVDRQTDTRTSRPDIDVFMHEFYHAVAGHIDGPPYTEESGRDWGFEEGATELYSSRHLAELQGETQGPLSFPGSRSNNMLTVILLEQVMEEKLGDGRGRALVRRSYLEENCSELARITDELFGAGTFQMFFKYSSASEIGNSRSAEFIKKIEERLGTEKTKGMLANAIEEYRFNPQTLSSIMNEEN